MLIKPLFIQGPSATIRLLLLGTLSLALMTMDYRTQHLASLRASLLTVTYPVQFLVDLPVAVARWMSEMLSSHQSLIEENASLRVQQVLLKAQLQRFVALEAENMRLRALLDSPFRIGERVLIAELLAVDLDPFSRKIVIDKGSLQGVFPGQPLLDADGVIGQVLHVAPVTSTAVLVTDPSHALPVQIERTGQRAIAVGSATGNCLDLPYILNNADVREGDVLVTSGMGGRFPAGYPAGRVTSVVHDPSQPFAQVTAEPSAHPERSRQVLLLWPRTEPPATAAVAPTANVTTGAPPPPAGAHPPLPGAVPTPAATTGQPVHHP